jgi:hypothetical protein
MLRQWHTCHAVSQSIGKDTDIFMLAVNATPSYRNHESNNPNLCEVDEGISAFQSGAGLQTPLHSSKAGSTVPRQHLGLPLAKARVGWALTQLLIRRPPLTDAVALDKMDMRLCCCSSIGSPYLSALC